MKSTTESSRLFSTRQLRTAGIAGLILTPVLAACGTNAEPPRAAVQTTWTPPKGSALAFDGEISLDGGTWPINCYMETPNEPKRETAEGGDTLLGLAHKAGTLLIQSPSLNGKDVPADVFAAPLAYINQLPDPDKILAGQTYEFPDFCRLG